MKKETPAVTEASRNNKKNIIKTSLSCQIGVYLSRLDHFSWQKLGYFCERIQAVKKSDLKGADFIDSNYILPIQRKINQLVQNMEKVWEN